MKVGQFRTYIISLLVILAIFGTRLEIACDFSDYHDPLAPHMDQVNPLDSEMDDAKYKHQILPNSIGPYVLPLPKIVSYTLSPTSVKLFHPLLYTVQSFPSRASPV